VDARLQARRCADRYVKAHPYSHGGKSGITEELRRNDSMSLATKNNSEGRGAVDCWDYPM
jgi:hypothetical protein